MLQFKKMTGAQLEQLEQTTKKCAPVIVFDWSKKNASKINDLNMFLPDVLQSVKTPLLREGFTERALEQIKLTGVEQNETTRHFRLG